MSFDSPKYFYDEADPPDLVNPNGPIYSRTPVNLGNIVPQDSTGLGQGELIWGVTSYDKGSFSYATLGFQRVVSHDLHVTLTPVAPTTNDAEQPLLLVGLSGYVELSAIQPYTLHPGQPVCLSFVMGAQSFNPGGTAQGAISVTTLGLPSGSSTDVEPNVLTGSCVLNYTTSLDPYDGGAITNVLGVLPIGMIRHRSMFYGVNKLVFS